MSSSSSASAATATSNSPSASPKGTKVRIGILVAHFEDSLQRELWQAIRSRATERGVSTVAYLGHGLLAQDPGEASSNVVYRMANPPVVDGLIVFTNNLGTFTGPLPVSELVEERGLPAVSIGVGWPGTPAVRVQATSALTQLVEHLITVHGRRHFALVTGPSEHPESRDREACVRRVLAQHGLSIDPRLTIDAGFNRQWGREAGGAFASSGLPLDAVVCLNDHMAIGVIEGLRHRGRRVPQDISVVGFDDLLESRWRRPGLTTIRQPVDQMGSMVLDLILERIAGHACESVSLEGQLIVRGSCGCSPGEPDGDPEAQRWELEESLERSDRLTRIRQHGVKLLGTFRMEALARQWEETLGALGLAEGALVLFEGTVVPLGREVPEFSRVVRWSPRGGLETQRFSTKLLFPPNSGSSLGRADWLVLPLVYRDDPLGYLALRCTSEDALVYETLRDQVSSAVKATLLMEASRSHENLLEREVQEISHRTMQAIGQDIHDDLCQYLAGISMLVTVLAEQTAEAQRAPVKEIGTLLDGALARARQYARTLYPPGLEEHGLVPAVQDLVESLQKTSGGVTISLQAEAELGITDHRVALQVYRILQEALGNAIRHSGGDLVLVRLTRSTEGVEAEVRDYGRGLSTQVPGQGMGLKILRYRAESIGARLELRNLDPGLCVSCFLPYSGTEHHD